MQRFATPAEARLAVFDFIEACTTRADGILRSTIRRPSPTSARTLTAIAQRRQDRRSRQGALSW